MQNIRATAAGTITPLKGIEVGAETLISPRRQKSGISSVAPFAAKDNGTDSPSRSQTPNQSAWLVQIKGKEGMYCETLLAGQISTYHMTLCLVQILSS